MKRPFRLVALLRSSAVLALLCLLLSSAHAQQFPADRPWLSILDVEAIRTTAQRAPMESDAQARGTAVTIDFPMPGGSFEKMRLIEAPSMSAELQAQHPDIRSYIVESVSDPKVFGRIAVSPAGVEGLVFNTEGDVYIRPMEYGSALHKVHYADPDDFPHQANDAVGIGKFSHQHAPGQAQHEHGKFSLTGTPFNIGDKIRKIRVSILTDGEYSQKVGGTTPTQASVLAALNAVFTSLNALYVRDMSVSLELTKHTIYLDPATDPFPNVGASSPSWLDESAKEHLTMNTNGTVPIGTYDIGQLFSARVPAGLGGGGASYLGNLCSSDLEINGTPSVFKAGVGSGVPDPQGSGWIFLLAHEFTHAFGANHTWSGSEGNCTPDQFGTAAAVEPGGGSTVVSYHEICSTHNIPGACQASSNYYHNISIQEVNNLIAEKNCLQTTNTANQKPTANANPCGGNLNIPKGTPFELTGSGSDPDGNGSLIYNWEQMDKAPARMVPWEAASLTTGPLFRSFQPSSTGNKRSFPSIANILADKYNGPHVMGFGQTQWNGEVLPNVARNVTMRLVVRDNNTTSGGVEFNEIVLAVSGTAGPFVVSAPNGGESIASGSTTNVTWGISGTDQAPINCANVNILLSTDGGATYTTLAANTPNDGSESVTISGPASATARIRVESATSTCIKFFDLSNANFTIAAPLTSDDVVKRGSAVPAAYARDVYAHENGGQAQVTIYLTEPAAADVDVDYATQDATAHAGTHYQTASGTATILAGQMSGTVPVALIDNAAAAPPVSFKMLLSNPVGATLLNTEAQVTVLNDDTDPLCNSSLSYQITGINCNPGADLASPLDDTYTFTVVLSESSGNSPGFNLGCDPTTYPYGQPVAIEVGTGIGSYWELATDLLNPNCYIAIAPGADLVPDYTLNIAANTLTLTDIIGNSDVLDITQDGTGIRFNAPDRLYSLNGGPATCFPVTVPLAGLTAISVNAAAGNDGLHLGAFTALLPDLSLNGGTGDDAVNFNGDINFSTDANLDVDLQNDDATPGTDAVTVAANANLVLSGIGAATVKVSKNVLVGNGGSIETANGDLLVEANQQAVPTPGNFKGVELSGGILDVSGSGDLTVKGEGGNAAGGFQNGVSLTAAAQIFGGTNGTVTVEGTGGNGAGLRNYGVYVEVLNSAISSAGAPVNVTGVGNGTGAGSNRSHGVFVNNFGTISAGGMGAVTVNGTGGTGAGGANFGVVGAGSGQITASGGPVTVVGDGGVGSTGSNGVLFQANASITSGGNGNVHVTGTSNGTLGNGNVGVNVNSFIGASGTGSTTVIGFGGAGTGTDNIGVRVVPSGNPTAMITSAGGPVSVTGTGGGTGASSSFNAGVACGNGEISAGGNGSVTIMGTGGTGTGGFNFGVLLNNAATKVFTANGSIDITGLGGAGTTGGGVALGNRAVIEAGGTGTVQVSGTGGSTGPVTRGVSVETGAEMRSTNGNVTVTGIAGGTGSAANNTGIAIVSDALGSSSIHAGGTGAVTLNGTGGATIGDINWGVLVGTNSSVFTENGPLNITGQGGGTGASNGNAGVVLQNGGKVTGGGTYDVTIHGTGGNSNGAGNVGVVVQNPGTEVASSGGDIHITGVEGTGSSPVGIGTYLSASVTTAAAGGDIFFTANSMKIEAPVSTDASSSVTLKPLTAGVQIDLGAATDPAGGPLGLTDTELDLITTGTLNIGSLSSGAITVSTNITRPASTNVNLTSGNALNLNASALNSNGGNVRANTASTHPTAAGADVSMGSGGTISFAAGHDLNISINGTTADAQYRQLNLVGRINLTGVDLVLSGSHVPVGGQTFTIVENDIEDAIIGTFNGLPQGAVLPNFLGSGLSATITYTGGDGNDVVLKVACPITFSTAALPSTCLGSTGQITVSAAAGGTPAYQYSVNNGTSFQAGAVFGGLPSGIYAVKVKDATGCESLASSVKVGATGDVTAPSIACPPNKTQNADPGECSALVTYASPTATDNCTASPLVQRISGPASGSVFLKGQTIVMWRATDGAGLSKTCSFRVTVNDNQPPSMTCPSPIGVNTTLNQCSATVVYTAPTFSDNCAPFGGTGVRISGLPSGSQFPVGVTNVVFRATDAVGLTKFCTLKVTVSDGQAPTIICPSPIVASGSGSPCKATVIYAPATATDNCGLNGVFLLSGLVSGSSYPAGVTTNTWRAIASNGQAADCSFTVTVNCATSPNDGPSQPPQRGGATTSLTTSRSAVPAPPHRGGWEGPSLALHLSPNPATTEVRVLIEHLGEEGGTLAMFDAQGRLVRQQDLSPHASHLTLSLLDCSPGLYFVTLRSEGAVLTKRLVKAE